MTLRIQQSIAFSLWFPVIILSSTVPCTLLALSEAHADTDLWKRSVFWCPLNVTSTFFSNYKNSGYQAVFIHSNDRPTTSASRLNRKPHLLIPSNQANCIWQTNCARAFLSSKSLWREFNVQLSQTTLFASLSLIADLLLLRVILLPLYLSLLF